MLNKHLISSLTRYLHKNMIDLINNRQPKQFLIITYLTNNSILMRERDSMCLGENNF